MRAREGTFKELMGQDRQFSVPLYQRHYKWNREQQADLWTDVLDQYTALSANDSNVPAHFIGSIVAVALDRDPLHDFRNFRVVDGQQRLITLSVALAALRDVAAEENPDQYGRLNAKYLVNTTESQGSALWPRLVPGDEDLAAYQTVLTNPSAADGHTPVGAAYRFFHGEISQLSGEGDLQVDRLANALGDRLSLVFVTVDESERPHKIFESINATGVALTEADLLRNYLFMALGERTDAVYQEHWRPVERLLGDSIEELVRDDVQSEGSFIKKDQVYREHRRRLEPIASDLDALEDKARALHRRGQYYRVFLRPHDSEAAESLGMLDAELRHLAFLRGWGASTIYPFLLHLYERIDRDQATHQQAAKCLSYVESFLVRRHLTDYGTRQLNRLFLGLITALPEGEDIDDALKHELSRDGRWPEDATVEDGVAQMPFYLHGRGYQPKLILERLEESLRSEVAIDFDASDLSIEHILPQTMSQGWRERLEEDGYAPNEVFARYGHTLGNLTLTAFNSEMSNSLIERKQEILTDSELRLNDPLVEVEDWGVDEIEDRATWLGQVATECWEAPIPGIVTPHAGFDWSRIDQAVQAIPMGRWTSYGDLASLGGTAAQPTANHVATTPGLEFAYRVLSSDGSVSYAFQWTDPDDDRDPVEVLTGEGIEFDEVGRASQGQRLSPAELASLADEAEEPE